MIRKVGIISQKMFKILFHKIWKKTKENWNIKFRSIIEKNRIKKEKTKTEGILGMELQQGSGNRNLKKVER